MHKLNLANSRVKIAFASAAMIAVLIAFCTVLGAVMLKAKKNAFDTAARTETSLVNALTGELALNMQTIDLSLQAVVDNLQYPGVDQLKLGLRQLVLFDRAAQAKELDGILVLDENGDLIMDSRTLTFARRNYADRDFFQAHLHGDAGLFIGKPLLGRNTGTWFIGVSRRLWHQDGSFAGVVFAKLRLSYFQRRFASVSLSTGGNITLGSADAKLLMRWPYDSSVIGRDLSDSPLYARFAKDPSGVFEYKTAIDGQSRLVAYAQVGDFPLVIGVGQASDDIYADWRANVVTTGLMAGGLCLMALVLGALILREFRKRERAEAKLAQVASLDGLTQLYNRYYLDKTLEQNSCLKERISVLMIDADHFKALNDRYGHQAGDRALQAIANCISACIRDGVDIAARYGGEEFMVVLPKASREEAIRVAERIRNRVIAEADIAEYPMPTVSIGTATLAPTTDIGVSKSELVKHADAALYMAKHNGRNRVEVADLRPRQIRLAG